MTTLAGSTQGSADGTGTSATFNYPMGIAIDPSTGTLYIVDKTNFCIRAVTSVGVVTTLAGQCGTSGYTDGTGTAAQFSNPIFCALDGSGNLYVADYGNWCVRKVTTAGGVVTSLPGCGNYYPIGVAVDGSSNVYFSEQNSGNHVIRKYSSSQTSQPTVFAGASTGNADGVGVAASFNGIYGIALDQSAGLLYGACATARWCFDPCCPLFPYTCLTCLPTVHSCGSNQLHD